MKNHFKSLAALAFVFGSILELHSQGHIVPNGVSFLGYNGFAYETHVIQNPATLDYTGFLLLPQSQTSFSFAAFADEGVRTFLVSSNSPVSLQPILANSYAELMSGNSYAFTAGAPFTWASTQVLLSLKTAFTPTHYSAGDSL